MQVLCEDVKNANHLSSVRLRCNILTINALHTDMCKNQSVINPLRLVCLTDARFYLSASNALCFNVLHRKLTDDRCYEVLRLWGFTVVRL